MPALACVMGDMDLVAALGRAGIPCAVVAPAGSPPTHSRHVRAILPWPDPRERPEELVEALLRFAAAQPERPVLLVQDDAQLLLVSRHRARLGAGFRMLLAGAGLVEDLVDKSRFARLADRLGLPVPATRRVVPAPGDAAPDLDLRFPVVVKPVTRSPRWDAAAGGAKALRAEAPEALRALWPRLVAAGTALLVQELVPGPETRIESHHLYVDAEGRVAGEFTGRKIRTRPAEFGHSTALEVSDAPDVATLGREVVRRLGLRGVAKLDFKRGPDGALHLLEVNPRCTLWHHLGAAAGVNLAALLHADLCGLARPPVAAPRIGATWCRPSEDRRAAREAGMPLLDWARWMLRCDANAAFDPRDPMPFLHGEAWNGLKRGLRTRLRRAPRRAVAAKG